MSLTTGTRLGPYEILAPLGAGAMGHVYRARDTRLGRLVAIKVLAPSASGRARRLDRLQREARAVSRVSHPHICALYDLGQDQDVTFLVMEHLEGETIARMLERGALPLGRALAIAIEIAEALDAAHLRGVIHRDLKPSNVMLAIDGVKLLDFGLAKLREADADGDPEPTRSLTLTEEGTILGTYPYMAPEQVEGREADARSDIFALGVVLYEMASGRRPFEAGSRAGLAAAILTRDPPALSSVCASAPALLDRVVAKCLAKDPDARWQSARDLASELRWVLEEASESRDTNGARARPQPRLPRTRRYVLISAIALIIMSALGTWQWTRGRTNSSSAAPPLHRQATFRGDVMGAALSPDGTMVAYVTGDGAKQQLVVRDLSTGAELTLVRARDFIGCPAWSPDGSTLLFTEDAPQGQRGLVVRSIPRLGGTPRRVAPGACAAWSPDGTRILSWYMTPAEFTVVDLRNENTTRVKLDGLKIVGGIDWQRGGSRVLIWALDRSGKNSVWTTTPEGRDLQKAFEPESTIRAAKWAPDGRAAYVLVENSAGSTDITRVALDGARPTRPTVVFTGLQTDDFPGVLSQLDFFDISSSGSRLLYARQLGRANLWHIDVPTRRDATPRPLTSGSARHFVPAISPDGRSIAYVLQTPQGLGIYRMTAAGAAPQQLTSEGSTVSKPAWSPDGKNLAYVTVRDGRTELKLVAAGGGPPTTIPVKATPNVQGWLTWTPDGRLGYLIENTRNFHLHALDSGSEVPLVSDPSLGALAAPHFDSQGKRIAAFWNRPADGQGLWVFEPGGGNAKFLGSWLAPAGWLPDDRSVVAYERGARDLLVIDITTGRRRRVAQIQNGTISSCDVSRDGTYIICSVYERQADAWIVDAFDPGTSHARSR